MEIFIFCAGDITRNITISFKLTIYSASIQTDTLNIYLVLFICSLDS